MQNALDKETMQRMMPSTPVIVAVAIVLLLLAGTFLFSSFGVVRANADYICTRIIDSMGECGNGTWSNWETVERSTDASGNTIERQKRTYTGQRTYNTVVEYLNLRTACDPGFEQKKIGDAGGQSGFHGGKTYTQFQVCQIAEGQIVTTPPTNPGGGTPPKGPTITTDPGLREETYGTITGGDGEEFDSIDDVRSTILRIEEQIMLDRTTFKVNPKLVRAGQRSTIFWESFGATTCEITGTNGDRWTDLKTPEEGVPTGVIAAETKYTLKCRSEHGAEVEKTDTVKIVPVYEER